MRVPTVALMLMALLSATVGSQDTQFEVASLKPSTRDRLSFVPLPTTGPADIRLPHVPLQTLILRGYPLPPPVEIVNLPSWASDPYDFAATLDPNATAEQRQTMFRAFLAQRLKLTAHYETKDQKGYNLVLARDDRKLGPGLTPTLLDCSQPPPPLTPGADIALITNACGRSLMDLDGTMRSAGLTMAGLARRMVDVVGRPVVDKTELAGFYAVVFRFFYSRAGSIPTPGDPPSVFTALPEQLGLKLQPATTEGQILVIDHIERPTEN